VGAGQVVVRLDRWTLEVIDTFPSDGYVVGLQRSRSPDELFVGWVDGVGVLDPADGTLLRRWPVDSAVTRWRAVPRRPRRAGLRGHPMRLLTDP